MPAPRPSPQPPQAAPEPVGSGEPVREDPDAPLLARIRGGDRSAWPELIGRHQDRVFAVCTGVLRSHDLAEEIAQDVFIRVLQKIDSFDGRAQFTTWLHRIAINACHTKLRSEKLRRHQSLDAPRGQPGDDGSSLGEELPGVREPSAERRVETREDIDRLRRAWAALPDEQRMILMLADQHKRSYDVIAEQMHVAVGTVKSRVFRARAALRVLVERDGRDGSTHAPGAPGGPDHGDGRAP